MLIAGLDEAGKGSVVGPMVIGAVVIEEKEQSILSTLGVKDSKKLSPRKREQIALQIKNIFQHFEYEVSASEIDELRKKFTMNEIMVLCFSRVLNQLNISKAIVDAADVNPRRFAWKLKQNVPRIEIHAEHKADEKYTIVGAASIIAKVKRDSCMKELERKIGRQIGSGYPVDSKTKRFLADCYNSGDPPDCIRLSWKTWQNLIKRESIKPIT
ncbi:MAG: ribonuclease HII [Methanocellales archaeon]